MREHEVHEQDWIQLAAQPSGETQGEQREGEADGQVEGAREGAENVAERAGGEEAAPQQRAGGESGQRRPLNGTGGVDGQGQQDPEEEQGGRCEAAQRGAA
ncbi:MAG: hypothetical protein DMF77_06675 [Acidobacteria bacterium]|nr:MAG: hypothetical protein DMF77_06675 [Acidobacteriota bacterium]